MVQTEDATSRIIRGFPNSEGWMVMTRRLIHACDPLTAGNAKHNAMSRKYMPMISHFRLLNRWMVNQRFMPHMAR